LALISYAIAAKVCKEPTPEVPNSRCVRSQRENASGGQNPVLLRGSDSGHSNSLHKN